MRLKFTTNTYGSVHLETKWDEESRLPHHGRSWVAKTSVSVGRTGRVRTKPRKPHITAGEIQLTNDNGDPMYYVHNEWGGWKSDSDRRINEDRNSDDGFTYHRGYQISTESTYTYVLNDGFRGYDEETGNPKYASVTEEERPAEPVMVKDWDDVEKLTFSSEEEISSTWWDTVRKTNIRV